ncbi:MAG: fibronectin type III domain-containing protein, partial [Acidobacteriota bacterium]|nr:fibronectin type III domain-containing protein [Acidobacteriota bacterium]
MARFGAAVVSTRASVPAFALAYLAALPAGAQQLLTYRDDALGRVTAAQRAGASASQPRRFEVKVDHGVLRDAPETLLIAAPDGDVVRAELREFTDRGNGDFLWSGHAAGAEWRTVLFSMADDGLSGIFASPGEAPYELHANESGEGAVFEAGWLARAVQVETPGLELIEPGAHEPWCAAHSAAPDGRSPPPAPARTASARADGAAEPASAALAQSAAPGISLRASPEEVAEDAAAAADITVTATLDAGLAGDALSIDVSVTGGTAVSGTDFAAVADFTVTIPAGAASGEAVFQFDPHDDDLPEPHETVVVAGALSGFDVSPAQIEIVSDDVRVIDVAVLYTPPVRAALATANVTMARDARIQFDYATNLLRKAGVAAEYRVVHSGATPADFDRWIASRAGFAIRGMSHGTRDITRLRDRENADFVHVMGAGNAAIWHCGQAYGRRTVHWRIEDYGFSGQHTTNISCAGSRGYRRWHLTAHEVGHSLGAYHERGRNGGEGGVAALDEVNDVLAPYAFGLYDSASPAFTTIMAYGQGSPTRIDHYSNVRAKYQGRAMGTADREEVERLLERTAAETADLSDHLTPGTPSNFTGQPTLNGSVVDIVFTWTDVTNREASHLIQYRTDGEDEWLDAASLGANVETATITGFEPGTRYNFRIYALNERGFGLRSETWSVTTPGTSPPAKPTGLAASAPGPGMARLTWTDNSHNETGFTVERRAAGSTTWTSGTTVGADVETADVTGLEHRTEYEFRVGAVNTAGTVFSETVFLLTVPAPSPAAPEDPDPLFGRRLTSSSAHLRWIDRSTDETGFRVQTRRPGDTSWTVAQSLPADTAEAFLTGLASDVRHEFRVEATGPGGSSMSGTIVLDLGVEPPPAIELTGSLLRFDSLWNALIHADLEWRTVSPFSGGFRLWSKPASAPEGAWSASRFTTTGRRGRHQQPATERIPMQFRVEATNDGGTTLSNVIVIDFGSSFPGRPSRVRAERWRPTEVRLTWREAARASAYRVSYGDSLDPFVYAIYPPEARQAIVTGLRHGAYTFRVAALDENGTAASTTTTFRLRRPANSPPKPVSKLAVDYPFLGTMRITWQDNASDEEQFVLSVRKDDGHWVDIRAGGPDAKPEGGLTVELSTVYHLRMLADNANGSLNSNMVTFRSSQEPTGVRVAPSSSTGVDISWTDRAVWEQQFQVQYKLAGTQGFFRRGATARKDATTASIDGLSPSTSYKFRVRARIIDAWKNLHWESSGDVTITMPPPPPSAAAASAAGSTSATVTWTDESSDETGFVVETRTAGSEWSATGRAPADATSADVVGLAAGATIEFRVRAAHDANGLSSPSNVATLTMPPPPPSRLTASPAGQNAAALAWTDESSDETGFVVEYRRAGESSWTTWGTEAPANAQTLTVTGLTAGESYEFRVRARSGTGLSSPSAAAVLESLGAPAAATALAATASGPSTADLTWTDGSTSETGFDVQYRPAGAGHWTTASTAAADSTSAAVTGLVAGRRYEFRVVAKNAHGSTPSATVSLTMPPRAPTDLQGVPGGSTAVELTWTDNASGETGYRVDYRLAGATAWTPSPATDPNATAYTAEGLTASTAYEFRAVALSADGETPSSTLTLTTPPAAPSGLAAIEAGATSATLTWTDNSSDETGFVIEYRPFRRRAWTTWGTEAGMNATTITVTGLTSGVAYGFRVYAKHDSNGLSSPSDEALLDEIGGPAAPSGVVATPRGSNRVSVFWTDNSTDETGFLVERRRGADAWAAVAAAPANATSAEAGPFRGGRTYEVRVSSRNARASRASAGVSLTMPPAAPTGLTAAGDGATGAALSWSDESFDETGFVVEYRDADSPTWTTHGTQAAPDSESMTVSGLVRGGTYGFRVFANHDMNGMSSPSREVWLRGLGEPPTTVTNLMVAATGSSSVDVTWTDGATDETGFLVQYRPAGGDWLTGAAPAANSQSAAVTGLQPSTVYSFQVAPAGGAVTTPSDPFVLTMPPAAPAHLSASAQSTTQAHLVWRDESSDETSFVIEYRQKGAAVWTRHATEPDPDSTGVVVGGLQAGGEYEFRVFAKHDANGLSSPSNVASLGALSAPAAPAGVTVAAAGSTSATVSWTAGGPNLEGYEVERRLAGTGTWTSAVQLHRNVTEATVGGLAASTAYDFRVLARNRLGKTPSTVVSLTMPPAAPSGLAASEASTTSVDLSWTDNSSDETAFVAEYKATTAQVWTAHGTEAAADATSLTVTGLAAGTAYEFRVKAKNANGLSSPSNVARTETAEPT